MLPLLLRRLVFILALFLALLVVVVALLDPGHLADALVSAATHGPRRTAALSNHGNNVSVECKLGIALVRIENALIVSLTELL